MLYVLQGCYGRRVIAKVIGGWHGFNTTLLQSVNYPFELDESLGMVQEEEHFVESINLMIWIGQ